MRILAGSVALLMFGVQAQSQSANARPQAIPDAPRPQTTLPNAASVTPGQGTSSTSSSGTSPDSPASTAPAAAPASPVAAADGPQAGASAPTPGASATPTPAGQTPTYEPPPGEGAKAVQTYRVRVNYVDLPFTVKDSKGQLVSGLTARDVQVYENGVRQPVAFFTSDFLPMSVALVIDQSMTKDEMIRVNDSLGALQGAFSPYDEVAIFTYNHGPKKVTDFTGAQSARLTQAIEMSKGTGRDPILAGSLSGPMSCTTCINNQNFDPNTAAVRGQTGIQLNPPREVHTLNDAILEAATALSTRPIDFRRVIYVISDGKDYGSEAKVNEVIKILLTNNIEVDGTLVGDSAVPYFGVLDRMHLPLMMRDNVLPKYAIATGGNFDSEFRTGQIEKSYARIASEARNRYTLGYYTHEPFVDGKYRKTEVRVLRPNLTVMAKGGYWPAAMEMRPRSATVAH